MFNTSKLKEWSDILLKLITIIAIPVGGWWAYHNYSISDTPEPSPLINVTTDVVSYDSHSSLLVVHVKPKNIGRVPITLTGGTSGGGITVTLKIFSRDLKPGNIDKDKLPAAKNIKKVNYKLDNESNSYTIEPGAEYDDIWTFVVPRKQIYFINAELELPYDGDNPDNGDEVDSSCV